MSHSAVSEPPRTRSFLSFWLPLLILALAAGAEVLLFWPSDSADRAMRNSESVMVALFALFLLAVWFVIFSGVAPALRLGVTTGAVLLVVAAGVFLAFGVRDLHFSGDMVPHFRFAWQPAPDDVLEAQRRAQPGAGSTTPLDLTRVSDTDYPEYRGRRRDGVVQGPALARDWTRQPPCLWRQPVGGGYAGFAVVGDAAVTIEQRRDQEAVVCYDTKTGAERWLYKYPASFQERMGGDGPRATPTIAGGRVYALGATGMLTCLDGDTGNLKWPQKNALENNNNLPWGMSGSPLVYDRVVVVNPGVQSDQVKGRELVAYDRETGAEVWHQGNSQAAYSSPMLATLAGERQLLIFDGDGLAGFDPEGKGELWRIPWDTPPQKINVAQPLVLDGDRVFITSGYSVGCAMLKVEHEAGKWSVRQLWQNHFMKCKFSSPVVTGGHLYGLDDGVLTCLDQETGKRHWREGRYGHGQVLLSGDLLVVLAESGELVLVEANPQAFHELGRFQALTGDKTWNPFALAGGKAFVRNHREMACYDLAAKPSP